MLLTKLTLLAALVALSATPVLAGAAPSGPIGRGQCVKPKVCLNPPLRPIR
jgi:hypothetical protein